MKTGEVGLSYWHLDSNLLWKAGKSFKLRELVPG